MQIYVFYLKKTFFIDFFRPFAIINHKLGFSNHYNHLKIRLAGLKFATF